MAAEPSVLTDIDRGLATVTLNRPKLHNAFDDGMIAELTAVLRALGADPAVRCVLLRGAGKSFCAGADLTWMRRMAGYGREENLSDAKALAELMGVLDGLPRPTVALVHGAAYGGGVGLVACCDIAVATSGTRFLPFRGQARADPGSHQPLCRGRHGCAERPALFPHGRGVRRRGGQADRAGPCDRSGPRRRASGTRTGGNRWRWADRRRRRPRRC